MNSIGLGTDTLIQIGVFGKIFTTMSFKDVHAQYLPSTKFYPVGLLSQKLNRLLLLPQMERLIERLPWMNQ
ncbi:hypothetical protein, partial [Coxiella burnetii]|uniref:hypothetical protein n=1 Tax=Coxiella burnetii TaxID=777 RepID=UPI00222F8F19